MNCEFLLIIKNIRLKLKIAGYGIYKNIHIPLYYFQQILLSHAANFAKRFPL